ncbi:hypothetical protein QJS10_CPA10g01441 [Acorus calamus]|uniref:Secreted protein n=1 Tax=Acorus calamus TaxID=4465 RepID=A0AAV9E1I2_ACOCL|nr:hypothetical protein QJS10_CPA10g01441 [Acorus calamus]
MGSKMEVVVAVVAVEVVKGALASPYISPYAPPLIWTSSVGMRDDPGIVDAESDPREELP